MRKIHMDPRYIHVGRLKIIIKIKSNGLKVFEKVKRFRLYYAISKETFKSIVAIDRDFIDFRLQKNFYYKETVIFR